MQKVQTTNNNDASAGQCAEQLLEVIPPVMRRIKLLMREGRSEHLSVPEFRALGYISRHPQTALSGVAEHAGLSVPAASRLVDALVDKQFVERSVSPTDRRQIALRLTEEGSDLLARTRERTRGELAAMLAGLSESERNVILRGLQPLRELFARAGEAQAPQVGAPGEDEIENKEGKGA
jgi:DNA-binding MarR family transcriptional regulator